MYRIRKSPNGLISASSGGKIWWIIFIIVSLFWAVCFILPEINPSNPSNLSNLSDLSRLLPALFPIPFLLVWIWWYKKEAKINKVKKFKKIGWWIIKKVKITSIEHYETSWSDDSKWFSWYYAEAEDWDMIYCSDAYSKWYIWWSPIPMLKEIYHSCWFEYNEKETHKQDVLRELDKRTAEKQYDAETWWFFKKIIAKWWLFSIKGQKEIIEKWYEPQYREVNWHRLTVWDIVDVYIDPNDEKNYWMDIDFLFDK